MRSSRTIAVLILERLGLDVALAGDLQEECARGRSTVWYWRQVLIAICVGIRAAVFDHKLLALRAIATGCAANFVWLVLWQKFLHFGLSVPPLLSMASIASLLLILLTQVATGWIIARTHRAQAIPMVLVFAIWLVLWYLADESPYSRTRYLAWYLTPISLEIIGLLVGGVLGAAPKGICASANTRPVDR